MEGESPTSTWLRGSTVVVVKVGYALCGGGRMLDAGCWMLDATNATDERK